MSKLLEQHPKRVWKAFKIGSFFIIPIGLFILVANVLSTKSSSPLMSQPGLLTTSLPNQFVQGKTEIIRIRADYVDTTVLMSEAASIQEIDSIPLGSRMKVSVIDLGSNTSPNLEITRVGAEIQPLDLGVTPTWEFKVTPLKAGNMGIGIIPSIVTFVEGKEEPDFVSLPMIRKNFETDGDLLYQIKRFVGSNWEWLMTAILIPLWVYFRSTILNALKKKKELVVES